MKNSIIFTFSIVLLFGSIKAQTTSDAGSTVVNKAKSFIAFSGGIASPMGKFASNKFEDSTSGYAKLGSHFALEGAYFLCSHFGIGGSMNMSSFGVDALPIAAGYREVFNCDSAIANSRPYHTVSFLIGPYFSWPVKKFTFDGRLLLGTTTTMSPDIYCTVINKYAGPTEGSVSTFVQTGDNKTTFGMQVGLGVRYSICKHWMVRLASDYFYSKPNLSFQNIGRSNNVGHIVSTYNQPITGITGVLGIGYEF